MALLETFHTTDPQMAQAVSAVKLIQNWIRTNIDLDLGDLYGEFRGRYLYRWSLKKNGLRMSAGCGAAFVNPEKDEYDLERRDYVLADGTYFEDGWRSTDIWAFIDNWSSIKAQILSRYNIVKARQSFVA